MQVTVGSGTVSVGGTLVVPVSVQNNSGFGAADIQIVYDNNNLVIEQITADYSDIDESITKYAGFYGALTANPSLGTVTWANASGYKKNAELFWIVFSAKSTAVNGDYSVTIEKIQGSQFFFTNIEATGEVAADVTAGIITVTGGIDPSTLSPVITAQPQSATYTYPTTSAEALTVETEGAVAGGTLSYQWYKVSQSGEEEAISGATSASYTPVLSEFGTDSYYCVVANNVNGRGYTTTSEIASITYNRAQLSALTLTPETLTYTGSEQGPVASIGTLTVGTDYTLSGTLTATAVGNYSIIASGKGNYTGMSSADWSIASAPLRVSGSKQMTLHVGGSTSVIDASVLSVQTVDGTQPTLSYTLTEGGEYVAFDEQTLTLTPLAAGSAVISVSASAANHESESITIRVTVAAKTDVSADLDFTAIKESETYTGAPMALSEFVNEATYNGNSDNITYRLDGSPAALSSTITNAGTYVVTAVYDSNSAHGEKSITVGIEKKTISFAPQWDYNPASPFTYDGTAKTVSVLQSSIPDGVNLVSYENNVKTAADTYEAAGNFEVADKANCQFGVAQDGTSITSQRTTQSWQILPAEIEFMPSWTGYPDGGFTYDGTAKKVTVSGVPENVHVDYTDNEKIAAGNYTAKAEFSATDTNHVVNVTINDLLWKINPDTVEIPSAVSGLVFDGTAKTGVPAGALYSIDGNIQTNAGEYDAVATLNDKDNYTWSDGSTEDKTIPWTIAQAAAKTLTHSVSLRYSDAAVQTVDVLSKLANAGVISNLTANASGDDVLTEVSCNGSTVSFALKSGLTASDAGKTATVTATFDSTNYQNSTLTISVTVIDKNDVSSKIIFANSEAVYNGTDQSHETATITGFDSSKITYIYEGDRKNVGSFTVTAVYDDADNHGEKSATFTIKPRNLSITGGTVEQKEYDGMRTAIVVNTTPIGLVNGESMTEERDYTVSGALFEDKNAGSNKTVTYSVALCDTDVAKNYTLTSASGSSTGTITPKEIMVSLANVADQTFSGSALQPAVSVSSDDLVTGDVLQRGTDYTVDYSANVNAGTATVTVSPVSGSNYTFDAANGSFTINKASAPTLTDEYLSYVYTESGSKNVALPAMPANAGTLTYDVDVSGDAVSDAEAADGQLSFMLNAQDASAIDTTTIVTVTVGSQNYLDATFTLTITRTDKYTLTLQANGVETTYSGVALTDSALSGTATCNGNAVSGAWSWVTDPFTLVNANEEGYSATVGFTPDDSTHYAYAETTITVVVHKATPTGTPGYTQISSSGKTLADAELNIGTIQPDDGTIAWVDDPATEVKTGVAYAWIYTPADTDNYNSLTGEIVLYRYTPPVTPVEPAKPDAPDTPSQKIRFSDVKTGDWYKDAVEFVVERGLFGSVGNGRFDPNGYMTRAMLVTVLWRLEGKPDAAQMSGFADVQRDNWYAEAVAWASENGIVTGYNDKAFGPNDPVTREQIAAVVYRYAKYAGYDVSKRAELTGFVDLEQLDAYARKPMLWAVAEGLIGGLPGSRLDPDGNATRAQVATILMRFVETLKR